MIYTSDLQNNPYYFRSFQHSVKYLHQLWWQKCEGNIKNTVFKFHFFSQYTKNRDGRIRKPTNKKGLNNRGYIQFLQYDVHEVNAIVSAMIKR